MIGTKIELPKVYFISRRDLCDIIELLNQNKISILNMNIYRKLSI